jgi:hypothetical protein
MEVIVTSKVNSANWNIPKVLLSHHSCFFRVACYGPFKEGLENRITIGDCDLLNFQAFVQWIYFFTFPDPTQLPHDESARRACRLWALGTDSSHVVSRTVL